MFYSAWTLSRGFLVLLVQFFTSSERIIRKWCALLKANISDLLICEFCPIHLYGSILTLFPARQVSLLTFCYLLYQTRLIWFLRKSQDYIQDFRYGLLVTIWYRSLNSLQTIYALIALLKLSLTLVALTSSLVALTELN